MNRTLSASKIVFFLLSVLAAILTAGALFCGTALAETGDGQNTQEVGFTVEYENLRELLKQGNQTLTQAWTNYGENVEPYQEMWETLKSEQKILEDMADAYEDDGDLEMAKLYESNSKQLGRSAGQINVMIRSLTSKSQTESLEDQADSLTAAAQSLMNSYNQMAGNVRAMEKQVEAAQASYELAVKKQAAGSAKASETESARNAMESQKNALASLKEQTSELRDSLLSMLGIPNTEDVLIGTIPEPDLEAVRSIDYEADKEAAVTNDSALFSQRREKVSGTDERALRQQRIEQAEAQAEMNYSQAYTNLTASLMEYEAALQAYESASLNYQALVRKNQAGLLSRTEWLQGEASYLSQTADKESAAMNLYQTYETYCWLVKGVA